MIQGKKQQIGWINCAKFFAILAVLVDHVKGILYEEHHLTLSILNSKLNIYTVSRNQIVVNMSQLLSLDKSSSY